MQRIVLASNNAGKLREISAMVADRDLQVESQSAFNVPEVAETGTTFIENAIIKARNASQLSDLPAIADDSGIEVMALGGRPGIYSARYAGEGASDRDNLEKLIEDVKNLPEERRAARFVCVMVFIRHAGDPVPLVAEGIWNGIAVTEPKGSNGFGYDPMFYVPTHDCTSAELPPDVKNQISHRGQALRKLIEQLKLLRTEDS
ncbi:MAG TPA: RdgB/HAM1 family non-canonical purine NTP pyrophosphatase [Gammaproteobacteria bacterium]|nr:RdgB/HAM1 family non-canonical purine NTP pyrophosphatase [Gammaproteobacteria bacterium]